MIELFNAKGYFEEHPAKMLYVGFLKSPELWFPLSMVSNPEDNDQLDSLFVARSYQSMQHVLDSYAKRLDQVEETLVQCLLPLEIINLIDRYGLEQIAVVGDDEEHGNCDCGCGCS